LPEENVRRFRNRLRGMRDRYRAGSIDLVDVECRVNAWIGHASQADTWRLRHAIFRGGMFDPVRSDLPSGPGALTGSLAGPDLGAFSAADPGTTNPGTCARRIATGTKPATETTTTGFGLPARPSAGTGASKEAPGVRRGVQGRP